MNEPHFVRVAKRCEQLGEEAAGAGNGEGATGLSFDVGEEVGAVHPLHDHICGEEGEARCACGWCGVVM